MSTQEAICVRFPNGYMEFTFTSATPCVGDRVRRGDDEFEVVTIGMDSNENRIVTLGASGDGQTKPSATPPRQAGHSERLVELAGQADVLKAVSRDLREDSRQLRRDGEALRG